MYYSKNIIYRSIILITLLVEVIVLSFSFMLPLQVQADTVALSISPPIIELLIKPGKSVSQTVTVTNRGSPVTIVPELKTLTPEGIDENEKEGLPPWITFLDPRFSFGSPVFLNENEEKAFLIRISPPEGTQEKEYYSAFLFTSAPVPINQFSASKVTQRLGVILLINVTSSGVFTKDLQIHNFKLPLIQDSFDALKVLIELKNIGNTYTRPNGTLTMKGQFAQTTFSAIPKIIFPGRTKKLIFQTPHSEINSLYSLSLPGFYIGRYTLDLSLSPDQGNKKIATVKTFYAIPWRLLTAIISVIVFVLIIKKYRAPRIKL